MRNASIERNTNETKIQLNLNLDGTGRTSIDTGCGFLNHMLTLFAAHGRFDLAITCQGDTEVDDHHTVEDIGIALGQAFTQALGDKRGITRYGSFFLPMDEALILCAVDLSGRDYLGWDLSLPAQKVGTFDTELAKEFWWGFVRQAPCSLHFRQFSGENTHHILEGAFKGAGRALAQAVSPDPNRAGEIPSTKGTL
jgi:imidazoleglycerol-phosphate dehydratase